MIRCKIKNAFRKHIILISEMIFQKKLKNNQNPKSQTLKLKISSSKHRMVKTATFLKSESKNT